MEEGQGRVPRHSVVKAMADQPDEPARQLGAMADHFLGGHALLRGNAFPTQGGRACEFLFTLAGLFQSDEQKGEQIVRERGEVHLGGGGGPAVGPGFLPMQFVFKHIENLFDFPAPQIEQRDDAEPQTVLGGQEKNRSPLAGS